jgi:hypothetical protein
MPSEMLCSELRGISSSEGALCDSKAHNAVTVTCWCHYAFGATVYGLGMLQKVLRRVKKIEDLFDVPLINVLP